MKKTLIALTALLASFSIAQAQSSASDASLKPAHSDTSFFSQDPNKVIAIIPIKSKDIMDNTKKQIEQSDWERLPSFSAISGDKTEKEPLSLRRVAIPKKEACVIYNNPTDKSLIIRRDDMLFTQNPCEPNATSISYDQKNIPLLSAHRLKERK